MGGYDEGVADGIYRGAVDGDAVEGFQKVIEEEGKVGGIRRAVTVCDEREIFDSGLVDDGFQCGISTEVVCEADGSPLAAAEAERLES